LSTAADLAGEGGGRRFLLSALALARTSRPSVGYPRAGATHRATAFVAHASQAMFAVALVPLAIAQPQHGGNDHHEGEEKGDGKESHEGSNNHGWQARQPADRLPCG